MAPSFNFSPINADAVTKIINGLKCKSSFGIDGLSNILLKSIKEYISEPIALIINQSFRTSIFPDKLKIAKVLPLFKKGDATSLTNYRPISILSSVSKIFERAIHNQITEHLESHKLLHPSQYGFRKHYSTELAGVHLVDSIVKKLNDRYKSVGIFMDLSKAFDTLDHTILVSKLSYFGFSLDACNLIKNYLYNRWQYVDLEGHASKSKLLSTGVPQGSILGPLLFVMYMNDITNSTESLQPTLYADDTTLLFSPGRNVHPANLTRFLNYALSSVSNWFRANRLSLNVEKTKFMIFHKKNSTPLNIELKIDDLVIERVRTFKFLGLMLNENLDWDDHYCMVKSRVSKSIGILHRLKHILPFSILLTLYHALVMSHLNFHILVWGFYIDSFFTLQKKAIRAITRSNFLAHTAPLFKNLTLPNLHTVFEVAKLKFYFRYVNRTLPDYFLGWNFRQLNFNHTYYTRYGENVLTEIHGTDYIERTLKFGLVKFINSIDTNLSDKFQSHSCKFISKIFRLSLIAKYRTECSIRNCIPCLNSI